MTPGSAILVPYNVPSYQCLSTDFTSSSTVFGASYKGANVYFTDTGKWYRISNNLTLVPLENNTNIDQNVISDPLNSSSASLVSGGSFVGIAVSTLGVAGIQVSLHTDQNCTVWIEQSPNGIDWDISDAYNYYTSFNNFGITVQAINSYYRVIVKNIGLSSQTIFRLQSALCPIVEALPRSLTQDGNLKVAIEEFEDRFGFFVENTPNDEMRVITPFRLVGSTFTGSTLDSNYWVTGSGSGSIVASGAQVIITTGSTANGSIPMQSVRTARYIGGESNRCRIVMQVPDTGVANNIRRFGAFTTTDGAFYELNGSTNKVITRKGSVDTPVSTGSFNGVLGKEIIVPTGVKTWEIYWNNSRVYFSINGQLVHTVEALNDTWTNTLALPVRFENVNGASASSIVNMNVRNAVIHRLGDALSQPTSYYFASGQTAGVNLKLGAGNLHSVVVNSVTNNSVITLADATSGSTPIITSMLASNTTTTPYAIDFMGLPFFTGLRLIVASFNASLTIIYE
jgi:hypothetical protein